MYPVSRAFRVNCKAISILTKSRFVREQLVDSFIGNADVDYAAYGEATR